MQQWGGPTALAAHLGHSNGSYLAQLAGPNPKREVGERTARQVEERLGLPRNQDAPPTLAGRRGLAANNYFGGGATNLESHRGVSWFSPCLPDLCPALCGAFLLRGANTTWKVVANALACATVQVPFNQLEKTK